MLEASPPPQQEEHFYANQADSQFVSAYNRSRSLRKLFGHFGRVSRVVQPKVQETRMGHRAFGFVTCFITLRIIHILWPCKSCTTIWSFFRDMWIFDFMMSCPPRPSCKRFFHIRLYVKHSATTATTRLEQLWSHKTSGPGTLP